MDMVRSIYSFYNLNNEVGTILKKNYNIMHRYNFKLKKVDLLENRK